MSEHHCDQAKSDKQAAKKARKAAKLAEILSRYPWIVCWLLTNTLLLGLGSI